LKYSACKSHKVILKNRSILDQCPKIIETYEKEKEQERKEKEANWPSEWERRAIRKCMYDRGRRINSKKRCMRALNIKQKD
jgi:hypothetical protein